MSLEQVIEEILSSAGAEREKLISQARSEAEGIISRAKKEAERRITAAREEAEGRADAIVKRAVSSAALEGKRMELEMRKRLLEDLKGRVMESILSRPQEDILRKLISKYGAGGERYYTCERFAQELKRIVGPKFGGTIPCTGGVVIEKEGGNVRTDCTYDTILEDIWNSNLPDISRALFGGDE